MQASSILHLKPPTRISRPSLCRSHLARKNNGKPTRPANSAPMPAASNINKLIPSLPSILAASILGEAHLPLITTISSQPPSHPGHNTPSNHQHQHSFTSSHQNASHSPSQHLQPSLLSLLSPFTPYCTYLPNLLPYPCPLSGSVLRQADARVCQPGRLIAPSLTQRRQTRRRTATHDALQTCHLGMWIQSRSPRGSLVFNLSAIRQGFPEGR